MRGKVYLWWENTALRENKKETNVEKKRNVEGRPTWDRISGIGITGQHEKDI